MPASRAPWTTIIRSTSSLRAPSAMRTPISWVRWETPYDTTPYTPTSASTSAIAPKIENMPPNRPYCQ